MLTLLARTQFSMGLHQRTGSQLVPGWMRNNLGYDMSCLSFDMTTVAEETSENFYPLPSALKLWQAFQNAESQDSQFTYLQGAK